MIEVSSMEFCDFVMQKNLKTSRKLSTLEGDNQAHIMVDKSGKVLAKSTKIKEPFMSHNDVEIRYYIT